MKLHDLTIYLKIVETGSLSRAAASLGITQPGISRTLREIESRMNAKLLKRTGRGVELTPAGAEFLAFAQTTTAHYAETQSKVVKLSKSIPDALDIAIPLNTSSLLILPLIRAFTDHLPSVTVHIYEEASVRIAQQIQAGERHLALMYQPPATPNLKPETMASESLFLVGRESFIGAVDQPIRLADIGKLPLILPSKNSVYRRQIETAFAQIGIRPNVVREIESVDALLAFAMADEGAVILPYSNFHREIKRGEIHTRLITDPAIDRNLVLVFNREIDRSLARGIRRLIKTTVTSVSKAARWR